MNHVKLRKGKATRTIPVGFSWTTMIFGCLPSLFNRNWNMFAAALFADSLLVALFVVSPGDLIISVMIGIAARFAVASMCNKDMRSQLELEGWEVVL